MLDVRSPEEWEDGHIPEAKYIFLPELEKKASELDKKQAGRRLLRQRLPGEPRGEPAARRTGSTDVRNVPGSWKAWKAAGLPVEKPAEDKKASDTDR